MTRDADKAGNIIDFANLFGQATATADAFVTSRTQVPAGEQPPDVLYHYTSAEGLIKILKSGEIWASSIRHLNDTSEYIYTLDLARRSYVNFHEPFGHLVGYLLDSLNIDRADLFATPLYFVASFSAKGNLLSQWRAYCPPGGGYSIGFDRTVLEAQARASKDKRTGEPWRLVRCEYDRTIQESAVNEICEKVVSQFSALTDDDRKKYTRFIARRQTDPIAPDPEWLLRASLDYFKGINTVAPVFKHSAFEEEAEWRLVSPLAIVNGFDEDYRPGKHSVVPYLRFSLPKDDGRLAVSKIFVGPTENPALASGTIRHLCRRYNVSIPEIETSGTPLRQ